MGKIRRARGHEERNYNNIEIHQPTPKHNIVLCIKAIMFVLRQ